MKRIKMLDSLATAESTYTLGESYEVTAETADAWIGAGIAAEAEPDAGDVAHQLAERTEQCQVLESALDALRLELLQLRDEAAAALGEQPGAREFPELVRALIVRATAPAVAPGPQPAAPDEPAAAPVKKRGR